MNIFCVRIFSCFFYYTQQVPALAPEPPPLAALAYPAPVAPCLIVSRRLVVLFFRAPIPSALLRLVYYLLLVYYLASNHQKLLVLIRRDIDLHSHFSSYLEIDFKFWFFQVFFYFIFLGRGSLHQSSVPEISAVQL